MPVDDSADPIRTPVRAAVDHGTASPAPAEPQGVPRMLKNMFRVQVLNLVVLAALLCAFLTGVGGRAGGVQAVRSLTERPLTGTSEARAGSTNVVKLTAHNGRRPVLFSVHAASGFPNVRTAVGLTISGAVGGNGNDTVLKYVLNEAIATGGELELQFPAGLSGGINGTITITLEGAGTGAATKLAAQGFEV